MTTIFAPATPPGRSGVAVLRISGPEVSEALQALGVTKPLQPRVATLAALHHSSGETIDNGLLLWFPGPHSFTGEDVLEIHTHGSRAVIAELVDILGRLPSFRMAEPGEFARQAFYNDKMDLTQAEGLADLIDAETVLQKRQALRQMQGQFKTVCEALRTEIIRIRAFFEAHIDFSDEEIPVDALTEADELIGQAICRIEAMLADARLGERLREGLHVVILGAPNAGKSTLLNALAKRDVAIVSSEPGTTRDILEVHLDLEGYPVILMDTAGIREASGEIEAEGIRRAKGRAETADLRLLLLDASDATSEDHQTLLSMITPEDMVIWNKSDLTPPPSMTKAAITISAKTGAGLEALISVLQSRIANLCTGGSDGLITRARHRIELAKALEHLQKSQEDKPLEIRSEELRLASECIGRITGMVTVDDILDIVFSSFCIGK